MLKRILIALSISVGSLVFGLIFVVIFVNANEVNCVLKSDHSNTCQIRTLLLGKIPTFTKRVEHIVDITLQRDSCDDGCSYRAEFVTAEGNQVPLSEVYTDKGPVLEQVDTLGSQMNRQVDRISYTANPPWWVLLLISGLTVMMVLMSPLSLLRRS